MAKKLIDIYTAISKEGGLNAQMRLAMITGIPGSKSAAEPDSPDNIAKFINAYKEITKKDCPVK